METASPSKQIPLVEQSLAIGKLMIYQNITVAEVNEGVHVTRDKIADILMVAHDFYGRSTPFIYVSNRVNSFSIDPLGYYEAIRLFPNLIAYAIVSQNKSRRALAVLEKLFIKKPIQVFDNLPKAIAWAEDLIAKAD